MADKPRISRSNESSRSKRLADSMRVIAHGVTHRDGGTSIVSGAISSLSTSITDILDTISGLGGGGGAPSGPIQLNIGEPEAPIQLSSTLPQNLRKTSSPTFKALTTTGNIIAGGTIKANGSGTATQYLDGTGVYSTPSASSSSFPFPFTIIPPVSSSFAWINQGGASISTTLGVHLIAPASAGDNFRIRKKAKPYTKFQITACMIARKPPVNFSGVGLVYRQSSDGKIVTLNYCFGGTTGFNGLQGFKYSSVTVGVAAYFAWPMDMGSAPFFLRIADDGTNRISSFSTDGTNFVVLHTVGRTDYLTCDEVGFFANSCQGTYDTAVTLLSWEEVSLP